MIGVYSLQSENYALSNSCGNYTLTNEANRNTVTDVTNLSVSLKVSGNAYVWVGLVPLYNSNGAGDGTVNTTANNNDPDCQHNMYFKRDSTTIADFNLRGRCGLGGSLTFVRRVSASGGVFFTLDRPAAGTYTYKVQVYYNRSIGTTSVAFGWGITYCKLLAKELNF